LSLKNGMSVILCVYVRLGESVVGRLREYKQELYSWSDD